MTRGLMRPALRSVAAAVAAMLLVSFAAGGVRAARDVSANDTARFLAGLAPSAGSPLAAAAATPGWRQHAAELGRTWNAFDRRQLSRVRAWASSTLGGGGRGGPVFYMFGGPDFVHAQAFFPHASTYVLSGLEPVGRQPELTSLEAETLASSLTSLRKSFTNFGKFGYFVTREMGVQFRAGRITGTLPVLFVFLARTGKTIHKVEFVRLRNGRAVAAPGGRGATGVRITFSGRGGDPRILYYFRTDLANAGFASSGFREFNQNLGEGVSLVKSASYLMHLDNFSAVRDFLLRRSTVIVQDDTGIPLRYFDPAKWHLQPYGQYLGPIPAFKNRYQDDLAELFKSGNPRPVKFGIGYRWHPRRTNVLVAKRRAGP